MRDKSMEPVPVQGELSGPGAEGPRAVVLREEPAALTTPEPTVMRLMELALQKGGDAVNQIERLVDLRIKLDSIEAAKEFARAMASFKEALAKDPILKDKKREQVGSSGTGFTSTWASTKAIARAIDPKLAPVGLSYSWSYSLDGPNLKTTCRAKHINGHFEETTVAIPTESKGGMSAQDKIASAQSYGERLSLIGVFGLTTSESTDLVGEHVDPTPISREDCATILKRLGANEVSLKKFLDAMRVETVVEIPAARLPEANLMIDQAIAAKKARAAT